MFTSKQHFSSLNTFRLIHLFNTIIFVLGIADGSIPPNCQLWNAALCKPTNMSTLYNSYTSDLVVDGNKNTEMFGMSCVHTNNWQPSEAWWMVDLMDEYLVHQVVITNRDGQYSARIKQVTIDLYVSDPRTEAAFPKNTNGVNCAVVPEDFVGDKAFQCSTPTYARYVKLMKNNLNPLTFCEIDVIVSKKAGDTDCQGNVSRLFDIHRNVVMMNGTILDTVTTKSSQSCLLLCTSKGYFCNSIYWNEETGDCSMLGIIDPWNVGELSIKEGTDLYVESRTRCVADGVWKYV